MGDPVRVVRIDYTNWQGVRAWRRVMPKGIVWDITEWHPVHQWCLEARDLDKNEDRLFSMKDIHAWKADEEPAR